MDYTWNLSQNISRFRKNRNLTQEELANFMGVTKASVSKWETGQNMPDLMLLPQLAGFFDVTVDELLGYEPQLSKEQIRKIYFSFASDFAGKPFEEVMDNCRSMVKKYYSCYPFLFQMSMLWLNHYMLAGQQEKQQEILKEIQDLCQHILKNCKDPSICNDTLYVSAMINLQRQRPQEAIEILEGLCDLYHLSGQEGRTLLIQAYQMSGKQEEAEGLNQLSMYQNLSNLLVSTACLLVMKQQDFEVCREFMTRTDILIKTYHLDRINRNNTAQYEYGAACVCAIWKKEEEELKRLKRFVKLSGELLDKETLLFSDPYFTKVEDIMKDSDLGADLLRNKKTILQGMQAAMGNPAFDSLRACPEFKNILKMMEEKEGACI